MDIIFSLLRNRKLYNFCTFGYFVMKGNVTVTWNILGTTAPWRKPMYPFLEKWSGVVCATTEHETATTLRFTELSSRMCRHSSVCSSYIRYDAIVYHHEKFFGLSKKWTILRSLLLSADAKFSQVWVIIFLYLVGRSAYHCQNFFWFKILRQFFEPSFHPQQDAVNL